MKIRSGSRIWGKVKSLGIPQSITAVILSASTAIFTALPSYSAEQIVLNYGLLEFYLSVSDLESFAETGAVSDQLGFYLKFLTPEGQENFRQVLISPLETQAALEAGLPGDVEVGPVAISKFFSSPMGRGIITDLGKILQTDSRFNGGSSIRAALVLSAADPEGMTLLNFLKKFPTRQLRVNANEIFVLRNALETLIKTTDQVVAEIELKAEEEIQSEADIDYEQLPDIREPGEREFTTKQIELVDEERDRRFYVDLYIPEHKKNEKLPVLIISHGLASHPEHFIRGGSILASHGFFVAIPQHPGSDLQHLQNLLTGREFEVFERLEFINRPLDIQFLIDELERRNRSELGDRLNLDTIGVGGHSFGGYTALALAGATIDFPTLEQHCPQILGSADVALRLQCRALSLKSEEYQQHTLHDPRVKAIYLLNPVSRLFGQSGMAKINIPVLMAGGDSDPVTPLIFEQVQPFTWLTTTHKYLCLLYGSSHTEQLTKLTMSLVPQVGELVEPDPQIVGTYVRALAVAFFKVHLLNDESYKPYLTAAYSDSITIDPYLVNLIHSFTPEELELILNN
ncbi:alpha/beta hydrolase [Roseofilum capinflatum]|uniref:Alpha/beta hydrolase n=1 Tax=Roseofilum capinflatum BLCC-M114 TaxID=3022440 RepID=A0ABT7B5J4_9CYAN|nr:alpha/beta hydrolase [Roseofilum capinflatum]MDJ1174097.1 alpha/beta hydrolase [Roseofilum capinflatum BLCC-M114]